MKPIKNWCCTDCTNGLNIYGDERDGWCDKCAKIEDEEIAVKKAELDWYLGVDKKKKKEKKSCKYIWYSVRPGNNPMNTHYKKNYYGRLQFKKRIDKFLSCSQIKDYIYTFEWKYDKRGDPIDDTIHCHMIIEPFPNMLKYINTHINRQGESFWTLNKEQKYIIYEDNKSVTLDKLDYIDGKTFCDEKNKEKANDKRIMKLTFGKEHICKFENASCETWRDIVKNSLQA